MPVMRAEVTSKASIPTSAERKKKRARRHYRGYALAAAVVVVVLVLLWFKFAGCGSQPTASISAVNLAAGSTSTTVAKAGTGASTTTVAAASTTTSTNAAVTDPTAEITMVLKVTSGSCWVIVKEDSDKGAQLYAGVLSPGAPQTFQGARQYWLRVGQPQVLTVTIGQKTYSLKGSYGTYLVTAAGIEQAQ